jgi:hypothetical protein
MVNRVVSNATRGAGKPRSFPLSPNPSPPIRCRSPLGIKFPISEYNLCSPVLVERVMIGLKDSVETYWYRQHPNTGWGITAPCAAYEALLRGWQIRLGANPDYLNLETETEISLFIEALWWEAKFKETTSYDSVLKILRSMSDRVRVNVLDPLENEIVESILDLFKEEQKQNELLKELLKGAIL